MRRVGPAGIKHLVDLEGLELLSYKDQGGYLTIGVGHLLKSTELDTGLIRIDHELVEWRHGLTRKEAECLLDQDLDWAEEAVNQMVKVDITEHQFEALVSFVFNVGPGAFSRSTLLRRLNRNEYSEVPHQMRRWVFTNKIRSNGLANRREKEITLWDLA